jgi:hypothetical protein
MSSNSDLLVANAEEDLEPQPLRFRDLDGGGLEEITSLQEADGDASRMYGVSDTGTLAASATRSAPHPSPLRGCSI